MRRSGTVENHRRGRMSGSAARAAAPLRRGALLVALAAAVPLTGCATKKDLKMLRTEMVSLQARQDSLFQALQRQNQAVLDTVRAGNELVIRVRGDLGHQLLQMDQQLLQLQELSGQSQRNIARLREQMEQRSQQLTSGTGGGAAPVQGGVGMTDASSVDTAYALGRQKLEEGAAATARAAFESILASNPMHPLAPDALFQIAETYVLEKNYDAAYREFDRMLELYPDSRRAPGALYRAGMVAKEQGNIEKARAYLNRVRSGYPTSDEARLAGEELRRLR